MADAGQQSGGGGSREFRQDDLIGRLVPDPGDAQPTVVFQGLLGRSNREGSWRLYLSATLDEYVEFEEQFVVHQEPMPEGESSLGGTTVWVKADCYVRYTHVSSRQLQADFLQGPLTAGGVTGAALSVPAGTRTETGYACTRNYVCSINPHIPACQLRTEVCASRFCGPATGPFCPTGAFVVNC